MRLIILNIINIKHILKICSKAILNRCIQSTASTGQDESVFSKTGLTNFFQEVSEDLHMCTWEIVYLCLIAFGN